MQQSFLLQILLLAQHVSGTTMPIIRSARVLYIGCCVWYFVLWFSSCWSGVELRVMCPVCRMLVKTSVASSWHFISTCIVVNTTMHDQNHIKYDTKTAFSAVFLRMKPSGSKHVENVKNLKIELKY